jgi:two-component system sensor histidine kinase/response regulator
MMSMKNILVIDDDETNLLLIQAILETRLPDYSILLATSGAKGIEIAQTEFPDAILLDIFMPEMDGFETCRKIKSNEATSNIPVLMISAMGQSLEIRVKGLQSGADAIISKPFDQEEFVALVNVMLRIKKAEDKLKKQNQDLEISLEEIKDYQGKLKKLNSKLSIAEEKERHRIAEYLHDGIGQTLSLVNIKLTSLLVSEQLPKTDKTIRESVELINNAINETRTLTYELSPPILYELGLVAAIKWRLEKLEEKDGTDTKLIYSTNIPKLSNDLNILLFRIVNELIVNSIKHAKTKCIEIELRKEEKLLYISVLDSGKGFDYKRCLKFSEAGGFGLFNIRERLDSIQGSLQFESENGKGTKAIVRIPL